MYQKLKKQKITMATLKSFIKNNDNLFVQGISSFSGMTDMVERNKTELIPVSKENAIGHSGVYCVGQSRDYFKFKENEKYFGIEVYNCCGCGILWTTK
jgi:hypothetical protein